MNELILRFDLDELYEEHLKKFLELVKTKKFKSHLFALEYQVVDKKLNVLLKQLELEGCDVGLHSEPFFPRVNLWKNPISFVKYGLVYSQFLLFNKLKDKKSLTKLIAHQLQNQAITYKNAGFNAFSHSLHARNNYMNFTIEENWEVFKQAPKDAVCFEKFFSHEKIMNVRKGVEEKQEFKPPYLNVKKEGILKTYTTGFDDTFFYVMKGDMNDAKENITKALRWCEANNVTTFVVSIHPYHCYHHNFYKLEELIDFLTNIKGWPVR